MRLYILVFFLGIIPILFLSKLPSIIACLGIFLFINICFLYLFYCNNKYILVFLKLICIYCLGFLWVIIYSYFINLASNIPPKFLNKNIIVRGQIVSLVKHGKYYDEFLFKFNNSIIKLISNKNIKLKIGDNWQFKTKLRTLHGLANPGGVDAEKLYFQENIQAVGQIQSSKENYLIPSNNYTNPLNSLRQTIQNILHRVLKNLPFSGIITALVIGDSQDISSEQWEVFRRTGTNHLVAISGLHIALISGFLYGIVNFVWRRISFLCLRFPAPHAGLTAGLIGASIYSSLAGFSVSTERAVIMIMVIMCLCLLRRNILAWYNILLALLLIIIINPLVILSLSFCLSFITVALIFYGVGGRIAKINNIIWKITRAQWVVTLCMLPISLFVFQQVSLVSFFANFLAIPWFEFITVPLSLLGIILFFIKIKFFSFILFLAERSIAIFWPFLHYLSSKDYFNWQYNFPKSWIFFSSMLGVLLLTSPRGLAGRYLGFFWLLPLLFNHAEKLKYGEVIFTLLDVGQGLSAVLQTQNHVLVFDTGLKLGHSKDMGKQVVLPFLRKQGISHVDTLVISHGDNDHAGGAEILLNKIVINTLLTSVPEKFSSFKNIASKKISIDHCYEGQNWQWDGVYFKFLNPPEPYFLKNPYSSKIENNNSCVLKITVGNTKILIPGDIEKPAENYLIHTNPRLLASDILVAPHHGSRSSSSPLFVYLVKPHYVLFPIGYHNRYHFPHPSIVQRYHEIGAQLFDTASEGAISFKIDKNGQSEISSYRGDHGHFWNLE